MNEKAVSINDLTYTYPDGTHALKEISLEIFRGESLGLIGPNGAGKTTLLLHLNGIFASKNGAVVSIMGRNVGKKTIKAIRKDVGIVFQDPDDQLFMPTVFDDVAFGPINMGCDKPEVQRRVSQALAWVGMEGYEKRSPHHLSIGEKKRIAIATVLSMSPEILVLDEPTSNLDPRSRGALVELVRQLPMTKIIATHDLEMIRALCQRTVVMDNGQIVADDLTGRILSNVSLLKAHGLASCAEDA